MMNLQGLQTDKLVPIELPEICAPRLELLGRFDKASAKRCIYVGAPAGCGKTVSTLLWIRKSAVLLFGWGLTYTTIRPPHSIGFSVPRSFPYPARRKPIPNYHGPRF